jgi:hypothetical protein
VVKSFSRLLPAKGCEYPREYLRRAEPGARPIGRQGRAVCVHERAADAIIGDQTGEPVEDAVEDIVEQDALPDPFGQIEELLQLVLAPDQRVGQQLKLMAEAGERIESIGLQGRQRPAAAQTSHPRRVGIDALDDLAGSLGFFGHDEFPARTVSSWGPATSCAATA